MACFGEFWTVIYENVANSLHLRSDDKFWGTRPLLPRDLRPCFRAETAEVTVNVTDVSAIR